MDFGGDDNRPQPSEDSIAPKFFFMSLNADDQRQQPMEDCGGKATKKSARLAEKRKLREEGGPCYLQDEDFYFPPYKSCRLSSPVTVKHDKEKSCRKTQHQAEDDNFDKNDNELDLNANASNLQETKCQVVIEVEDIPDVPKFRSSEEEKWFDSLDVDKLDDMIDNIELDDISGTTKLLTERQKSLIFRSDTGLSLDIEGVVKEEKTVTRDMVMDRIAKCERRRILARQKKEHDKKKTIDRILKKSQIKVQTKSQPKSKTWPKLKAANVPPVITYVISKEQNLMVRKTEQKFIDQSGGLEVANNHEGYKVPARPKDPIQCGVKGCTNRKRYNCSKTNVPLCSLECYKKNMELYPTESKEKKI